MKRIFMMLLCAALLCGCTAPAAPAETAAPAEQSQTAAELPAEAATPEQTGEIAKSGTVTPLMLGETVSAVLGGVPAALTLTETPEGEYETPVLRLSVDGTETVLLNEYGWMPGAWLYAPAEGEPLLVVTVDLASDDYDTMVFGLSEKTARRISELYGAVAGIETDGTAHLSFHIDVLGTWGGMRDYRLSAAGMTPVEGSEYTIGCEQPIVTSAELPIERLEGGAYAPDTLPAGTEIYPTATDNESYMAFRLPDGGAGRLRFTRQDYEIYIDGKPEEQFFQELFYAG